jgi:hypothetical protein
MSKYKEYYANMSFEMKAWRSKRSCLKRSIRILKDKLAPFLIGHFEGRTYVGTTLLNINKLKALEDQLEYLKANRPEVKYIPEKKEKVRKIRIYTWTYDQLLDKFEKLSGSKKASVLETALYYMQKGTSNQKYICIFMAMGYKTIDNNEIWVKNL